MNENTNDYEKENHPAVELLKKGKPFIAIAYDKPYFKKAFELIREHEIANNTWTREDEGEFIAMTDLSEMFNEIRNSKKSLAEGGQNAS